MKSVGLRVIEWQIVDCIRDEEDLLNQCPDMIERCDSLQMESVHFKNLYQEYMTQIIPNAISVNWYNISTVSKIVQSTATSTYRGKRFTTSEQKKRRGHNGRCSTMK